MTRTDIIQRLIDKNGYKYYLEIGVQTRANNFDKIKVYNKVCVDPDAKANADWAKTSDEYFEMLLGVLTQEDKENHDIIFIDGMHEAKQCRKDIENSLKVLIAGGTIVVHDCLPINEEMTRIPRETKQWVGDCYKAIAYLIDTRPDLNIVTVDTDWGCAIIQKKAKVDKLNYTYYEKNRNHMMNVVSVEDFEKSYL